MFHTFSNGDVDKYTLGEGRIRLMNAFGER